MSARLGVEVLKQFPVLPNNPLFIYRVHSLKESLPFKGEGVCRLGGGGAGCAGVAGLRTDGTILACSCPGDHPD